MKWIIGLLAVIVIAVGGYYMLGSKGTSVTKQPVAQTTTKPQPTPQTQTTPPAPTNGMSASNDTSDAAIAQDTAAVDAQVKSLNMDSASVDQGMNDKPIAQQ